MSGAGSAGGPQPGDLLAEPPIFIFGSGRSGTTLLQSILSAHPRIAIAPETHFCRLSEQISGVSLDRDPPDFDAYWTRYAETTRFADVNVSPERCRELIAQQGSRTFRTALAALLAAFQERTGKARVGEKTPRHMHYTKHLFEWFPEARMIALQRDPRAVIASEFQTPWRRPLLEVHAPAIGRITRLHVAARSAASWARINGTLLPELSRDPRVKLVSYEALVGKPEPVVRDVCAFLGETFEPAMLEPRKGSAQAAARDSATWNEWMSQHNATANSPISTGSTEKWRRELTPREVAVIEAVAGRAMAARGYDSFVSTDRERRTSRMLSGVADAIYSVEKPARLFVRRIRGRA